MHNPNLHYSKYYDQGFDFRLLFWTLYNSSARVVDGNKFYAWEIAKYKNSYFSRPMGIPDNIFKKAEGYQ